MEQQVSDSIIRKIQLLLQLGQQKRGNDGASNENEAAVAMAKAQELLTKYNLDLATVGSAQVEGGTAAQDETREQMKSARTAMYNWQVRLCKAICEANFCWHWVTICYEKEQRTGNMVKVHEHARKVKRHVILGRKANQMVAQMMYEYLADTIENVVPYKGRERLSSSANSWREGCAERLIERIQAKSRDMRTKDTVASEQGAGCTAMVVRDLFEKEYIRNYDANYGDGAYARSLQLDAEAAEEEKQEEEERKQLLANETDEERELREREEARAEEAARKRSEKYWEAEARRERKAESRRDWRAYSAGREKGNDIGLDAQLNSSNVKGKLK
jgi:hypothetical protein